MSHLSSMFGPADPPPQNVKVGAWVLCPGCSRASHLKHEPPCHCDICTTEETA